MINKRFVIVSTTLTFILFVTINIYGFVNFYITDSDALASVLGYTTALQVVIYLVLSLILAVLFAMLATLFIDIMTDYISPREWKVLELTKKDKEYYRFISPRGGSGSSGYRYYFYLKDSEDKKYLLSGRVEVYTCMIVGAKTRVQIKRNQITDIEVYDGE